jgi:glutamate racemase
MLPKRRGERRPEHHPAANVTMSNPSPIGVFDSGLGGLSVLREIRTLLPNEDYRYYADNAYCPYGLRSPGEIRERSIAVVGLLIEQGAKAIVVACNTASAMAITEVRAAYPGIPIIGLEPAVKPAVAVTRSGRVGVLATPRTAAGERLRWLIETYAGNVQVHTVAAAGLVELVESGTLTGPEVVATLQPMLDPMIDAGVDVVVLGCTHYPYLRREIERYMGDGVLVIDSGAAIARRVQSVLASHDLFTTSDQPGSLRMMTSGDAGVVEPVAALLLGEQVIVENIATSARMLETA